MSVRRFVTISVSVCCLMANGTATQAYAVVEGAAR